MDANVQIKSWLEQVDDRISATEESQIRGDQLTGQKLTGLRADMDARLAKEAAQIEFSCNTAMGEMVSAGIEQISATSAAAGEPSRFDITGGFSLGLASCCGFWGEVLVRLECFAITSQIDRADRKFLGLPRDIGRCHLGRFGLMWRHCQGLKIVCASRGTCRAWLPHLEMILPALIYHTSGL